MIRRSLIWFAVSMTGGLLTGCNSNPPSLPPLKTVTQVDLPRFVGDWYVIASIPTFIETDAYNAIESYRLDSDGSIDVTFTFRDGGYDGKLKRYQPRAYIADDPSGAVWRMQFIWPFTADYRITYLSTDYTQTIISRVKRDYVWIMSRTPTLPIQEYEALLSRVAAQGYDRNKVRKVPQRW